MYRGQCSYSRVPASQVGVVRDMPLESALIESGDLVAFIGVKVLSRFLPILSHLFRTSLHLCTHSLQRGVSVFPRAI